MLPVSNQNTIFIQSLNGKALSLPYDASTKVANYCKQIELRVGLPFQEQRLLFGGKQLNQDLTFMDYNIPPNATLHLVSKLLGGFRITVQDMMGKGTSYEMGEDDTVYDLKYKIEENYNNSRVGDGSLFAEEIQLQRKYEKLENKRKLSSYSILSTDKILMTRNLEAGGTQPIFIYSFKNLFSMAIKPQWGIQGGLNIEAKCETPNCSAKNKVVWIACSYSPGEGHNMNKVCSDLTCEKCNQDNITVTNYGFHKCSIKAKGRYRDGNSIETLDTEDGFRTPDEGLFTFAEGSSIVRYDSLRIITKPIISRVNDRTRLLDAGNADEDWCSCTLF